MPMDMKAKIGETLSQLLCRKPLDKITVKELVDTCGISRQTFYYHFQDIYEVIELICQYELIDLIAYRQGRAFHTGWNISWR